ncbi:MAG: hypothetical protein HY721_13270 [Planctomycetes bacterium]|nr:hypothetical protein [Planctomycetota bacterium]
MRKSRLALSLLVAVVWASTALCQEAVPKAPQAPQASQAPQAPPAPQAEKAEPAKGPAEAKPAPAAESAPAKIAPAPAPAPRVEAPRPQVVPAPAIAPPVAQPPAPVLLPSGPPKRQSDPQAIAVVETYLKAIGGKEVLQKIKDRATKFRNVKHQATGETVANINLLIKDGILIREEWEIEGFQIKDEKLAFIQIYNGHAEEGWVLMLGTVSALDGRTLQVFVWDKQMDDFFCHWEDDGYVLTLAGQGEVPKDYTDDQEVHPCDILLVTDFSGRQDMKFFFSRKNGLILKKEWQDTGTNPKSAVRKEQYYRMYRDLAFMDGSGLSAKLPLKLEIYLDGDLDTERIYTNVRFNSGLSDKLFDKPEGKPFKGAVEGPQAKDSQPPGDAKTIGGEKPQEGSGTKAKGKKTAKEAAPSVEVKAEERKPETPPVPPAPAGDGAKTP